MCCDWAVVIDPDAGFSVRLLCRHLLLVFDGSSTDSGNALEKVFNKNYILSLKGAFQKTKDNRFMTAILKHRECFVETAVRWYTHWAHQYASRPLYA